MAKLAAAGVPADQLFETADTFSLGRLYGLLERTRRLDAESESFDYDWRSEGEAGVSLSTGTKVGPNTLAEILWLWSASPSN